MTITGGSALPKEDIDRMVSDAEAHAEEDQKRREEAEVRNQAESLVHQTEKVLTDNSDKIPDDTRAPVQEAITEVNEALKGEDIDRIRTAVDDLAAKSQTIGQAVYGRGAQSGTESGAAGGAATGGDGGASSQNGEDVVDAEVVDEDDKKS